MSDPKADPPARAPATSPLSITELSAAFEHARVGIAITDETDESFSISGFNRPDSRVPHAP